MTILEGVCVDKFCQAWETAEQIDGWLTREEALLLYATASVADLRGKIVEIGTHKGKSAEVLLSATTKPVITLDPTMYDETVRLKERWGRRLRYMQICSEQFVVEPTEQTISLLYIDGDHEPPAPRRDFEHFEPHLLPGAYVAFHDRKEIGPSLAIDQLVTSGVLEKVREAGTLWVGRYLGPQKSTKTSVFVTQPSYGKIEPESYQAVQQGVTDRKKDLSLTICRHGSSLLANCVNQEVVICLNDARHKYFAMVHGDLEPDHNWCAKMIDEMHKHDLDVIHAVAAIKNLSGMTSTAVAYTEDIWAKRRRLSLREVNESLPETFDIEAIRARLAPESYCLLPNTGCIVVKTEVLKDFPGFAILDRIRRTDDGKYTCDVLPEDWNFGFWCAANGVRVGGTTAVKTRHYGRSAYDSDFIWGSDTDDAFFRTNGEYKPRPYD